MEDNGITDNGQTESRTAIITRTAFRNTIETLKNALQMFLRHSVSCIIIVEIIQLIYLAVALEMKSDTISGIFKAVLYKILDYGVYQCLVSCQNRSWLKHVLDLDPVCDNPFSEFFEDLVGYIEKVDVLFLEL